METTSQSIKDLNLKDTKPGQLSVPEKLGHWLFKTTSNWQIVLAFSLITALTYISIRFNIELGDLNSVDDTSKDLLPSGYALLDLAALFLSGYVGLKTKSLFRKAIAWIWFVFLVSLSLWAAASFTMSVDYRQARTPLEAKIEQKKKALETQRKSVSTWQKNVEQAVVYKTKHQKTLDKEQLKESKIASDLAQLEEELIPSSHIIYHRVSPYVGIETQTLQLIIRLAWAAAITLSPLIIALLITVEILTSVKPKETKPSDTPDDPSGKKWRGKGKSLFSHIGKSAFTQTGKFSSTENSPLIAESTVDKGKKVNGSALTNLTNLGKDVLTQIGKADASKSRVDLTKSSTAGGSIGKGKAKPRTADSADTGIGAGKGTRYTEVREKVISAEVRPSKPAIKKAAKCGQPTAEKYLEAMAAEGILKKRDDGRYELSDAYEATTPLRVVGE